jgi:hypothetical protein
MQRDRDGLFAVLHFTAAASAGFELTVFVFVHYPFDSLLLS